MTQKTRKYLTWLLIGPLLAVIAGIYLYFTGGRYISTDNAYIKAAKTSISAEVNGRIAEVDVTNNSLVKKGQLLFKIDPETYELAVRQAEANLGTVRSNLASTLADYQQKAAALHQAEETVRYQE